MATSKRRCVITNCVSKSPNFGYTKLHGFPKDPVRRRAWMAFCRMDREPRHLIECVCSGHFTDEDYLESSRILGRPRKEWLLNRVAVPTLFGPDENVAENVEDNMHIESMDNVPMNAESENIIFEDVVELEEDPGVIMWTNPTGICRLCMKVIDDTDTNAVHLFQETEDEAPKESLSRTVFQFFQLELEESSKWPSIACGQCVSLMQQVNQLKNKIVATHCQLYNRLVTAKKRTEPKANRNARRSDSAHLEQKILEMGLMSCRVCGAKAENLIDLKNHMHIQHQVPLPYIYCCDSKHAIWSAAMDHMAYHLNNEAFKCSTCGKCSQSLPELRAHEEVMHPDPVTSLACPTCGKRFARELRLRRHQLRHLPNEQRPYKCSSCPARFSCKAGLRRHVQRMHDIKERHVCDQCGKAFSSFGNYYDHKKKAHREAQECPICSKQFKDLETHLKRHSRSGPSRSGPSRSGPSRSGPSRNSIMRREDLVNGDELVNCPVCNEEVARNLMRSHSLQHVVGARNRRSGYCSICLIRIKGGGQYKEHMDEHMGIKHPCDYCPGKQVVYDKYGSWYLHMKSKHPTIFEKIKKRRNTTYDTCADYTSAVGKDSPLNS